MGARHDDISNALQGFIMSNNGSSELSDDDIVISGISGVFPEANNLDELKEKLFNNSEFIKINDGSLWEQGLNPENLRNTGMAVIMGSQISESESVWIFLSNVENGFGILGHNRAMVANRVSYWFNCSEFGILLQAALNMSTGRFWPVGHTLPITYLNQADNKLERHALVHCKGYSFYSAETAGIEGLTLAHEAIKKGYCETALVGTITFALHPELSYNLKELGVLSEDGCNRSFDDKVFGHGSYVAMESKQEELGVHKKFYFS
uniref:Beta-ketoacyl synthase-like N-terminal domain-containing protein n=1 Tax=Timema tahoe TaxID=61484 RepID=A0A7R9FI68_9NEOP|nr:unnamed protein product [Timema tahoe]